jgi:RHS repeat-associated protein
MPPNYLIRGYTGHEHIDDFGLINMNARLYDPLLARMLSPDNFVQDGLFTQNYNRYSYAYNNPLRYSDPDGEFIVPMLVGAGISVITNGINNLNNGDGFFKGAGKAAMFGAAMGAFSFGIGTAANSLFGVGTNVGKSLFQMGMHGLVGAEFSKAQGGTIWVWISEWFCFFWIFLNW